MRILRADLHVHSCHSLQSGTLRFLRSRDCYSRPEDVYRTAKARGMDLVTITDHDSVAGCLEFMERRPDARDFFMSEEVSCRLPQADVEVHLGVYGTTERLHRELQPLRRDVFEVAACLREAGVFFTLNHLFHFYRGQVPLGSYLRLLDEVPGLECRNGAMLQSHNLLVEQIAHRWAGPSRFAMIGGSDAHTLRRVGRTWTEVPAEDATPDAFLSSVRACRARPAGAHGRAVTVAADTYGVVARYAASLVGAGPCEQPLARRVGCLAFTVASLPAQFLPLTIAASGKRREAEEIRRVSAALSTRLEAAVGTSQPAGTQA